MNESKIKLKCVLDIEGSKSARDDWMKQKTKVHVTNTLPTRPQHVTNTLPTRYHHVATLLRRYQHVTNTSPTRYQHVPNRLPTGSQHGPNTFPTSLGGDFKAGFHMSHFIVFHRISSEFWVYDQLGLIPIYENQPNHMKTRHPNSS